MDSSNNKTSSANAIDYYIVSLSVSSEIGPVGAVRTDLNKTSVLRLVDNLTPTW